MDSVLLDPFLELLVMSFLQRWVAGAEEISERRGARLEITLDTSCKESGMPEGGFGRTYTQVGDANEKICHVLF